MKIPLSLIYLAFSSLIFLVSCVTHKQNGYQQESAMLRPGMPRQEIISKLGQPQDSTYTDGVETLRYNHPGAEFLGVPWTTGQGQTLSVKIENGVVKGWKTGKSWETVNY